MHDVDDQGLPAPEEIGRALARHLGRPDDRVRVLSAEDLSPGLGPATVLAVTADTGDGSTTRWIAKIPVGGNRSPLDPRDPGLAEREARFFAGRLPDALPPGLAVPPDAGTVRLDGRHWILMRDVRPAMGVRWTPADAHRVARAAALLHAPVTADPALLTTPWLERRGHAAYAHHVAAGHRNLDLIGDDPRLADLFTTGQVRRLHACLDALDRLTALAGRLEQTLLHGDLHLRNLGRAEDGTLLLIDWEHVGAGPVGVDLATFVSLYRLFGGEGELDEPALLAEYAAVVSEIAGRDLTEDVRSGYGLRHLTSGLHLRLGPGLTAVRQGVFDGSPGEPAAHVEDIRAGALRALRWAEELGLHDA